QIAFVELLNRKSASFYDFLNSAIETTAAGQVRPHRRYAILPPPDARFWREAMFYEEKPAARPQHPAYFLKCLIKVGNAAHRPRGNDRIDVCVADWNSFCSAFDQLNRQRALCSGLVGHL